MIKRQFSTPSAFAKMISIIMMVFLFSLHGVAMTWDFSDKDHSSTPKQYISRIKNMGNDTCLMLTGKERGASFSFAEPIESGMNPIVKITAKSGPEQEAGLKISLQGYDEESKKYVRCGQPINCGLTSKMEILSAEFAIPEKELKPFSKGRLLISLASKKGTAGIQKIEIVLKSGKGFLLRDAVIVLPDELQGEVRFAARELAYYIGEITGKKASLISPSAAQKTAAPKIYIGKQDGLTIPDLSKCSYDGYFLSPQQGKGLLIAGKSDKGTEFGIYGFLQDICGVKFYLPGRAGTYVPRDPDLKIDITEQLDNPFFKNRNYYGISGFDRDWARHNRLIDRYPCGHALYQIITEKYAQSHPEYFAYSKSQKKHLVPGRGGRKAHNQQPCMTNPEVIEIIAKYVIQYFNSHPNEICMSLGMNDSTVFCECPRCLQVNEGSGFNDINQKSNGKVSAYFYNEIAKRVSEVHPDKFIGVMGYNSTRSIPIGTKLHPNIIFRVAEMPVTYFDPGSVNYAEIIKRKQAVPNLMLSGWRYGTGFFVPNLALRLEEQYLDVCKALNIFGLSNETYGFWTLNGIKDYLYARKMWNPDLRNQDMLNDFCKDMFGAGAQDMLDFYHLARNTWETQKTEYPHGSHLQNSTAQLNLYNENICRKLTDYLTDARKKAGNDIPGKIWLDRQYNYFCLLRDIQKLYRQWKQQEPETLSDLADWCIRFEKMRRDAASRLNGFRESSFVRNIIDLWFPPINVGYLLLRRCAAGSDMSGWEKFIREVGDLPVFQWMDRNKTLLASSENLLKNPEFKIKGTPMSEFLSLTNRPDHWECADWGGNKKKGGRRFAVKDGAIELTGIQGRRFMPPMPVITQKITVEPGGYYLCLCEMMSADGEGDLTSSWISGSHRAPHTNTFKPYGFFVSIPGKNAPKLYSFTMGMNGLGTVRYKNPRIIKIPDMPQGLDNALQWQYDAPPVLPEPKIFEFKQSNKSSMRCIYPYEGSYALKIRLKTKGKGSLSITATDYWGRYHDPSKTVFSIPAGNSESSHEFTYQCDLPGISQSVFFIKSKERLVEEISFTPQRKKQLPEGKKKQ